MTMSQNLKDFSKQKRKTWKTDSPDHSQKAFGSTPQSTTPFHTARPEAPCTELAKCLSQEVLCALNHIVLEPKGALDLFQLNLLLPQVKILKPSQAQEFSSHPKRAEFQAQRLAARYTCSCFWFPPRNNSPRDKWVRAVLLITCQRMNGTAHSKKYQDSGWDGGIVRLRRSVSSHL